MPDATNVEFEPMLARVNTCRPLREDDMPTAPDPAPCNQDEQLYECLECGKRLCSAETVTACPGCGGPVQNLSRPRPE